MALTIADILRAINPNIGLVRNADGSFRIGVEDVNSDEVLVAVAAINTALQAGGITQAQLAALLTQIVLAAGTNIIGKVGGDLTKTIQTELMPLTAVAASVQSISSELALTKIKKITIFIDHAKDNAAASVGQGTEYVVQVSEKATGNDTWRSLAAFTASMTAPTSLVTDGIEAAGQTVIEIGATIPVVGDIVFFKNATIANSEWANVIAVVSAGADSTFTIESGLTNTQAQGTYFTQGEHFVLTIDVEAITRLRVVCNNTKGTTNRAIVWRCAAITVV